MSIDKTENKNEISLKDAVLRIQEECNKYECCSYCPFRMGTANCIFKHVRIDELKIEKNPKTPILIQPRFFVN